MRAFVFTDKKLERRAGQFVWLSINTEKKENAPVLAKFPVEAWPSFFVVDPQSEKVVLRWVGGATVSQVDRILDDGRSAAKGRERGVDEILARADRLYGEGKNAEAVRQYRLALAQAPEGWPRYARATESLLFALDVLRESRPCAETARAAFPKLARTSSAANVAALGLTCATRIDAADPARADLIAALADDARAVLAAPPAEAAADDVSSLYGALADEREEARDAEGRRKVLSEWATYLEKQAAAAPNPAARMVYDSHRVSAYIELNEPERAIPMLEASQRDAPDDYNPPARLALAYRAMHRWDDALAASDRALARAYGPRKIGILTARAEIFAGKGDAESARKTLEEAVAYAESLPPGQRSEKTIASLKKKLAAASSGGPSGGR
ncbi:MAG TPA: tetratricopeptide repeat protein [Thermoanaerobaculia bacterium]|nr:tetratricopeptide repeat protein [Thermoanaerobaculia bacterium]